MSVSLAPPSVSTSRYAMRNPVEVGTIAGADTYSPLVDKRFPSGPAPMSAREHPAPMVSLSFEGTQRPAVHFEVVPHAPGVCATGSIVMRISLSEPTSTSAHPLASTPQSSRRAIAANA
ncbi:MAG: hypothetical protein IPK71_17610 [Myxococcales bacterium]|nr:hypothetical protein [Myxococcales bacterium]